MPLAPVTFTSLDCGSFPNGLPSITVRADDKGVGKVTFSATPGTLGKVNILAASPQTQGQCMASVPQSTYAFGLDGARSQTG